MKLYSITNNVLDTYRSTKKNKGKAGANIAKMVLSKKLSVYINNAEVRHESKEDPCKVMYMYGKLKLYVNEITNTIYWIYFNEKSAYLSYETTVKVRNELIEAGLTSHGNSYRDISTQK